MITGNNIIILYAKLVYVNIFIFKCHTDRDKNILNYGLKQKYMYIHIWGQIFIDEMYLLNSNEK